MAISEPSMSPVITVRRRGRRLAWMLWISVTVLGAVITSLVAWQLRSHAPSNSVSSQQIVGVIVAVETQLIISTGQWLVLRHYKMPAHWWIPASVAANVIAGLIVLPPLIGLAVAVGTPPITRLSGAWTIGMLSLGTSGLVVGTAQAFVLRASVGKLAWAWIAGCVVGGVVAASATSALSVQLIDAVFGLGLPFSVLIGAFAALGALVVSTCQTPVLMRLLR
jgi:hypothetical protein